MLITNGCSDEKLLCLLRFLQEAAIQPEEENLLHCLTPGLTFAMTLRCGVLSSNTSMNQET